MTGERTLTVRVRTVPEAVVVAAIGDLDLGTAPMLLARAGAVLAGRPGALIVDLDGIGFCGSAGLQVLAQLVARTSAGGVPLAVVANRHAVLRVVRLTRLDEVFTLHATVDDACAWVRRQRGSD
ncbi:STAS domain-containing protein [Amycolatopsis sp. NBC_01488]|uniref:STAS domain-containing protein n=1 Tax=Amycolatopsis sp. NBC_01488 TaxID=2903563 RepID=UPI002E2BB686|nr:STAS domain-containing protein [Amycolatopsis sp. NBC_01488]